MDVQAEMEVNKIVKLTIPENNGGNKRMKTQRLFERKVFEGGFWEIQGNRNDAWNKIVRED